MKPAVYFKKVNGEVKLFFRKDFLEGKIGLKPLYKSASGHDFSYFKNWALSTLKKQYDTLKSEAMGLKEIEEVTKGFRFVEAEMKKAFPVGTIRTWKGKKFIKSPDKKWRPYYDEKTTGKENSKDNLGRRRAILAIARKINALQDGDYKGLYDIIQANKDRFFSTNSDKTKMIELYEAMKEKGAVGSSRFSKPKKKAAAKIEVKPEPKKDEAKPKESEEKKEEPKDKDIIPKDFKEMVIKSKATGKKGVIHPIGKEDVFEGTWLEGAAKGKTFVISKEGILDGYEIVSVEEKTEKEEPKTEEKPKESEKEKEEEKTEKVTFTTAESKTFSILRKLLPTSTKWWPSWHDGGRNNVNFNVGSIREENSIKGIIKNNKDCDEKRLLAITALITDAALYGECTEEKEGKPESKWNHSPSVSKKFEKNGVIVSVYYSEKGCLGKIRSIDTETNKEAFEKAIKDFEAKVDASEGFEGEYGTMEKWENMLEYIKKAKRRVKAETTRNESEKNINLKVKEHILSLSPTVENMIGYLDEAKVKHNPLGEKRDKPLPEDEIIKRLANYDGTKGSCLSQAFCYVTQKMGYDILDFRGGKSKEAFSGHGNAVLTSLFNTSYLGDTFCSPHASALECLEYAAKGPAGTQYIFTAGCHCAIVRKNKESGELQYLELQLGDELKGWQNFYKKPKEERGELNKYGFSKDFGEELNRRFHTKDRRASAAEIINIDAGLKPEKENDFLKLMGYINTQEGKQKTLTREEWERKGRLIF